MDEIIEQTKEMWVDTYSPKTMDELVITDAIRNHFKNMIDSGNITNMMFAGVQGIGKTTLANIIVEELNAISLTIECGREGNIDTMRDKVATFCNSMSVDDRIKIVILDEADSISGGDKDSSGQKALRNIIEANQDDTRFILTCNYPNKIMKPIHSRCPPVHLKFTGKDVIKRLRYILDTEGVKYVRDDLIKFVEDVVKPYYPDIRRMVNTLQNCCSSGELIITNIEEVNSDLDKFVDELIAMVNTKKSMNDVRRLVLSSRGLFDDDFQKVSTLIFNKVIDTVSLSQLKSMTEYIFRMSQVSDPEIQFFGLLLEIRG